MNKVSVIRQMICGLVGVAIGAAVSSAWYMNKRPSGPRDVRVPDYDEPGYLYSEGRCVKSAPYNEYRRFFLRYGPPWSKVISESSKAIVVAGKDATAVLGRSKADCEKAAADYKKSNDWPDFSGMTSPLKFEFTKGPYSVAEPVY